MQDELYKSHYGFIKSQVTPYVMFGLDECDLTQEASRVWVECCRRTDPTKPAFLGYAKKFIRRALLDYAFANQRIVSPTRSRRIQELIFDIRKESRSGSLSVSQRSDIATRNNSKLSEVDAWSNYIIGGDTDCWEMLSNEIPHTEDLIDLLCWSEEEAQLEVCKRSVIRLPEAHRLIIKNRYFNEAKITLSKLADSLGVTTGRVWQIEKEALGLLREQVESI